MRSKNKTGKNKIGKNKTKSRKVNKRKIKGGTINPFSDFFGIVGTMTYNLSNALSSFTINSPPAYLNSSENPVNPNPSKQFLQAKA